jgi:hypothetical protein
MNLKTEYPLKICLRIGKSFMSFDCINEVPKPVNETKGDLLEFLYQRQGCSDQKIGVTYYTHNCVNYPRRNISRSKNCLPDGTLDIRLHQGLNCRNEFRRETNLKPFYCYNFEDDYPTEFLECKNN